MTSRFATLTFLAILIALLLIGAWYVSYRIDSPEEPLPSLPPSPLATPTPTPTPTELPDISVTSPQPNETVSNPLVVRGEARGTWYFEASFPIRVEDTAGTTIAIVPAQAKGEWMTENFVPFEVTIPLPRSATGPATLILEKDNPSGLPENADSLEIPIILPTVSSPLSPSPTPSRTPTTSPLP